ncbi:hypothetical protein ID866_7280 [Astraeus odoratus]|nr:hypothetical protein ID866_7280 [Astraeus odoratus]
MSRNGSSGVAQDTVIAIMGATGSGKSNFINKLTGRKEKKAARSLQSATQNIKEFKLDRDGRHYVFVDTPSFDDIDRSDREVLRTIADWLDKKYRGRVKLAGVVYTHRITDNRMSGSACKNLDLFTKICGDNAAKRVRLVTTMWDTAANLTMAESRVEQLEGNFWKPLLDVGVRHERFRNTTENAWGIVNGLIGETAALLLQEELAGTSSQLYETTAGKALYTSQQKCLYEEREMIRQLKREANAQEDPTLARELQAEHDKVEAHLHKTWKEPIGRRISRFFTKK